MSLILRQETASSVPTPDAGKGTVFLNTTDQLTVKDSAGNVSVIPTFTATNNTSVFFNDAGALGESANLTFVKTTNTLSVAGNVVAGGVKTDNLYYANGNPWDLQQPAGSNTAIQFNDNDSFGGSANFVWNKTTNTLTVTGTSNVTGTFNATGNITGGNVSGGNLVSANFLTGTLTTSAQPNITSVGTLTTLTTSGNAVIGGNLTVNGNITYINVETFDVEDPIISVGGGPNGAPLTSNDGKDRGLLMHYYTSAPVDAYMGWDNGNGEFAFGSNVSVTNDVVTYNNLGNARASTFIGNVSGATGNFTGNVNAANANLGNTVTGNYFTGVLTYAAQPNITSVGTLQSLLVGATASSSDYSNAKAIASQDNSGATGPDNIGLFGEAVANSANANITGIGLLGVARANSATKGTGVQGEAKVTNTADTGAAVGVRGYATDTHAGGYNIGVLGNALGSGVGNYAFYVQNGGIASIENTTFWDLTDNSAAAITFNSTGKANIFGIETTDNAEGIFTSGYLNVTGNASVGGIKTNNYYYANGSPVDFQQAGGTNTQVQFNDADGFGGSAAFTFNKVSNVVTMSGNLSVANVQATGSVVAATITSNANANVGNLGTGGLITATGNVTGGNLVTGGAVSATGNVSGGNLTTGGALSVTGNANVGNLGTGGLITATGNVTGGNLVTGGVVSATGNVTGGNLTTAGALSVTGNANVGNIGASSGIFTVNVTSGNVYANSGTIGAQTLSGEGGNISNIQGANVSGTVATATTAGTVTTNAQPNITSVGTLSSLAVTANATAGNVYANSGTIGASLLTGTLTTASQPNITSVGTLTSLGVTGNVTAANFIGNLANGNSDINIPAANGNINFDVAGNANVLVVTGTGANIAGTLNATGNANVGNLGATGVVATTLDGSLTTASQPNITSVGTLSSLAVTASVTAGNVYANSGTIGASLVTGTLTTAAQPNITSVGTLTSLSVTGNATAGNVYANSGTIGASLVTGTLTTAAQPNITSVGTLTSASVSGNVTAGNVYANSGTIGASSLTGTLTTAAQPNITSVGTLTSLTVTGNVTGGNLVTGGVLTVTGTGVSSIAGNLDMTSNTIINLATPTNPTDAATKQYVDDVAQGLHTHDACQAATPDTLANITGGTITYNNGASGVGANLVTTGSFNLIDGVNVQTAGTRILVKNEANSAHNGIYVWSNATVITRADDFNTPAEMAGGDFTFVQAGTLYDNTGWVMPDAVTTVGTSPVVWIQFSGAGTYTAGTGLGLNGSQFFIANTAVTSGSYGNGDRVASFTVNSQGQLTAASNVVIAANAANLTGTTLNSSIVNSSLTSVGTLGTLNVTGNANVGNIGAAAGVFTTVAGSLTTASQPNITTVGTVTSGTWNSLVGSSATFAAGLSGANLASITGANVTGTVANATDATNASALLQNTSSATTVYPTFSTSSANGNSSAVINTSISANLANASITATTFVGALSGAATSATTAGTVTTAAQPNITSVGTLTSLAVTGNASAGNLNTAGAVVASTLTSNIATGTAPLTVTSTTRVANLNVAQANVTDFISVAAGTGNNFIVFANAATGNVSELTSTGLIANLSNNSITATTFVGAVSGDLSAGTSINASNISSGTLAQARLANSSLTVNGTSISLGGSGTVTANTTQALTFNNSGSGDASGTTFDGGTARTISYNSVGAPSTTGTNASGTWSINVTGSAGSATTAGTVTTAAQPNITSVGTLTSLVVAGNISQTSGYEIMTTNAAVTAAGTVQGNATAITTQVNVTSTVPSGSGVVLPTATAGLRITIINIAANACLVYPASGGQINALGTNVSYSLAAGGRLDFQATSSTQWYTLNATYA